MLYAGCGAGRGPGSRQVLLSTDSLIPVNGLSVVCCMQDVEQDGDLVADKSFSPTDSPAVIPVTQAHQHSPLFSKQGPYFWLTGRLALLVLLTWNLTSQ